MMTKVYIAIPYSGMEQSAYRQANIATAVAMNKGYNPFSPITHSHPLVEYGVPSTWEFWSQIDLDWIEVCDQLWVITPEEGEQKVKESTGVQAEIKHATELGKWIRRYTLHNGQLIKTHE